MARASKVALSCLLRFFVQKPETRLSETLQKKAKREIASQPVWYFLMSLTLTSLLFGGCTRPVRPPVTPISDTQTPAASLTESPLETAKRASRNSPKSIDVQLALARAAGDKDPALAASALRKVLELDPKNDESYRILSAIYEKNDYLDRLMELMEARLKSVTSDIEPRLRLAALYSRIEADKESRRLLSEAAGLTRDDPLVVEAQAIYAYQFSKFQDGVKLLKDYLSRHPDSAPLLYRLSELHRAAGQFAEAETAIRIAIKLESSEPVYHRQLAHILITSRREGVLKEAENEAKQAILLKDKNTAEALYWQAMSLLKQKRIAETIAAFEAVAKIDVSYDRTAFQLGTLYSQNGKKSEGAELLKLYKSMESNRANLSTDVLSIRSHPERVENYRKLASIYRLTGDYGTAAALLRFNLRRYPKDRSLLRELRNCLSEAGRTTEAAQIIL